MEPYFPPLAHPDSQSSHDHQCDSPDGISRCLLSFHAAKLHNKYEYQWLIINYFVTLQPETRRAKV
jgi:hypothetical protein